MDGGNSCHITKLGGKTPPATKNGSILLKQDVMNHHKMVLFTF
jgi:hypothetical protein